MFRLFSYFLFPFPFSLASSLRPPLWPSILSALFDLNSTPSSDYFDMSAAAQAFLTSLGHEIPRELQVADVEGGGRGGVSDIDAQRALFLGVRNGRAGRRSTSSSDPGRNRRKAGATANNNTEQQEHEMILREVREKMRRRRKAERARSRREREAKDSLSSFQGQGLSEALSSTSNGNGNGTLVVGARVIPRWQREAMKASKLGPSIGKRRRNSNGEQQPSYAFEDAFPRRDPVLERELRRQRLLGEYGETKSRAPQRTGSGTGRRSMPTVDDFGGSLDTILPSRGSDGATARRRWRASTGGEMGGVGGGGGGGGGGRGGGGGGGGAGRPGAGGQTTAAPTHWTSLEASSAPSSSAASSAAAAASSPIATGAAPSATAANRRGRRSTVEDFGGSLDAILPARGGSSSSSSSSAASTSVFRGTRSGSRAGSRSEAAQRGSGAGAGRSRPPRRQRVRCKCFGVPAAKMQPQPFTHVVHSLSSTGCTRWRWWHV